MDYLIKDQTLQIQYQPGKGAWTYHLIIPNTKNIKARWGFLKVSGTIDNYPIESKNLAPVKNSDKWLSLNGTIRKAIQKNAGDTVLVSLYIDTPRQTLTESQILECLADAEVLNAFNSLDSAEQQAVLGSICGESTEDLQTQKIVALIEKLGRVAV